MSGGGFATGLALGMANAGSCSDASISVWWLLLVPALLVAWFFVGNWLNR